MNIRFCRDGAVRSRSDELYCTALRDDVHIDLEHDSNLAPDTLGCLASRGRHDQRVTSRILFWTDTSQKLTVGGVDVQANRACSAFSLGDQFNPIPFGDNVDGVDLGPYRPTLTIEPRSRGRDDVRLDHVVIVSACDESHQNALSCRRPGAAVILGAVPTGRWRGYPAHFASHAATRARQECC